MLRKDAATAEGKENPPESGTGRGDVHGFELSQCVERYLTLIPSIVSLTMPNWPRRRRRCRSRSRIVAATITVAAAMALVPMAAGQARDESGDNATFAADDTGTAVTGRSLVTPMDSAMLSTETGDVGIGIFLVNLASVEANLGSFEADFYVYFEADQVYPSGADSGKYFIRTQGDTHA